jgi:hypothetical protein
LSLLFWFIPPFCISSFAFEIFVIHFFVFCFWMECMYVCMKFSNEDLLLNISYFCLSECGLFLSLIFCIRNWIHCIFSPLLILVSPWHIGNSIPQLVSTLANDMSVHCCFLKFSFPLVALHIFMLPLVF